MPGLDRDHIPPLPSEEPPQQLSADPAHPWYSAYWVSRVKVLVNGIERRHVTLADGPGRVVEAYAPRPWGHSTSGIGVGAETLGPVVRYHGDVVLVRREAPGTSPRADETE